MSRETLQLSAALNLNGRSLNVDNNVRIQYLDVTRLRQKSWLLSRRREQIVIAAEKVVIIVMDALVKSPISTMKDTKSTKAYQR